MQTENNYIETDLGNVAPNPQGEYVSSRMYEYLDLVTLKGGSYLCVVESTSVAPVEGQNSKEWQIVSLSGNLTPEYIAMHDDVVSKATEVASNTAVVEAAVQNVSGIEANIEAIQKDVQSSQQDVQKNKDIVVGVEKAVRLSEQNVKESEQNVNAQVNSFNQLVLDKTQQATTEIDSARQAAVGAVTKQQELSVAEVKTQTSQYITEQKESAKQEIDATKRGVVQAVTNEGIEQKKILTDTTAGEVKKITDEGATQLGAVRQEGTTQVETVAAEGVKQKGILDDTVQAIIADRKQITQNRDDIVKLQIKETAIGKAISVSDSAEFPFVNYKVFGKTEQIVSTGKNLCGINELKRHMGNQWDVNYEFQIGQTYTLSFSMNLSIIKILGVGTEDEVQAVYSKNKITFTPNKSVFIRFDSDNQYKSAEEVIKKLSIQLEKGSEATPYEPYTGGKLSPSVDTPSPLVSKTVKEIKVAGINLLKQPYLLLQNDTTINGINVHINDDYSITLKGTATAETYINLDKITGIFTATGRAPYTNNGYSLIAIGIKDAFLYYDSNNDNVFFNVQKGKTISETVYPMITLEADKDKPYEPYEEQNIKLSQPVTLRGIQVVVDGNYIDENNRKWVADYIDTASYSIVRNVKEKNLTADDANHFKLNWEKEDSISYLLAEFVIDAKSNQPLLATHFQSNKFPSKAIIGTNGVLYLEFQPKSTMPTLDKLKEFITGNEVKILYLLNKSTTERIPEVDQQALKKLHTFYPNTVIMTDEQTGQELTYIADQKNYIDKKLKQIVQANVRSTANLLSLMPLDTQASMIENDTNNILHDMEVQKHE